MLYEVMRRRQYGGFLPTAWLPPALRWPKITGVKPPAVDLPDQAPGGKILLQQLMGKTHGFGVFQQVGTGGPVQQRFTPLV